MSFRILSLLCCLVVTACGGGGGGGSSAPAPTDGRLSVGVSDAPVVGASEVVVAFTGLELKPREGDAFSVVPAESPLMINLLDYQNGERAMLLDNETVGAGDYNWMRLQVVEADSYVIVDGQQNPLEIPSGEQSGLKLNRGFAVAVGALTDFTIEIDLRKSLTVTGNGRYKLRPTLRLVDNLETNSLSGTVDSGLIVDETCQNGDNDDTGNAVYLFEGGAAVQDIQGNDGDPLTTSTVVYDADTETYRFTIAFLAYDDYRLVLTCNASADDPEQVDELGFTAPIDVTVTAEPTTPVSFL